MSRQLVIKEAAAMAAEKFGVDPEEVFSTAREASLVAARHWAFWQLSQGAVDGQSGVEWSASEIARLLDRDGSAVAEGIRAARKRHANTDTCQEKTQ